MASLKVSIPLNKIDNAAFFHESNVLHITNDTEMHEMFESLFQRREQFLEHQKGKTEKAAAQGKLQAPLIHAQYEDNQSRKAYRYQLHFEGVPKDPRKPSPKIPRQSLLLCTIGRYDGDLRPQPPTTIATKETNPPSMEARRNRGNTSRKRRSQEKQKRRLMAYMMTKV